MISVPEARERVLQHFPGRKIQWMPLHEANGCLLAEEVHSPADTPPFHQSAMDGYAFSFGNWDGRSPLAIAGEVQAGSVFENALPPATAARIFTGAQMPQGADTVVIRERVTVSGNSLFIDDEQLVQGRNVRPMGSQTKQGDLMLSAGMLVTPAAVSFLASTGITTVKIFSKPSVSVVVTGNELLPPGEPWSPGKIYESNASCLVAALASLGIVPGRVERVVDDEALIRKAVQGLLHQDILIITGGVSAGDHDLVAAALDACGTECIFHKVRQKPGMPFYFGKAGNTLVFGLPGNPASVLTCYYEYVVPAISCFTGITYYKREMLPLSAGLHKKKGMTHFLKGKVGDGLAEVLGDQESYKMNSFAVADCLVELEEGKENFITGEPVWVQRII
jgi:molybdopterin molybdotransferase